MSNRVFFPQHLLYQGIAEPPKQPEFPELSWSPSYPDQPRGRTPLPVAILTSFFFAPVETPPVPPFDPADGFPYPEYADFVRAPEPVNVCDYVCYAYVPAADRWGLDKGEVPWAPQYPDFARGPTPLVHEQYSRPEINPPDIPPPELSWSPEYPDFAPGPTPLVYEGVFVQNIEPLPAGFDPALLAWTPSYPDFAPGLTPLVAEGEFAVPEFPVPLIPPPELSWAPQYPDFARNGTPTADFPSGVQNVEPVALPFDPAELSWTRAYPDFARGPERAADFPSFARPEIDPPTIPPPELSWAPEYPDFARGREPLVHEQYTRPEINPPDIPPPDLSWAPGYPDFVRGREPLVQVGEYAAPEQAPPLDPARFPRSYYPDFAPGPERLQDYTVFSQNVEPLPPVPAPELSWSPTYPDILLPAARTVEFSPFVTVVELIIPPFDPATLSWEPTFVDIVPVVPPHAVLEGLHVQNLEPLPPSLRQVGRVVVEFDLGLTTEVELEQDLTREVDFEEDL